MLQWLLEKFGIRKPGFSIPPIAQMPKREFGTITVGLNLDDAAFKQKLRTLKKEVLAFDKKLTAAEKRHARKKQKPRGKRKYNTKKKR